MPEATADQAAPQVKYEGTGVFTPPGETPPPPPQPSPETARRLELLVEHKRLGAELAALKARRAAVEEELAKLDARQSLALKLAALTPAERELLELTLAEKAQKRIDEAKAAEAAASGANPADGPAPTPGA